MRRILIVSALSLFASALLAAPGGMTLEQYLEQSGIDPAEPAFVRIVRSELPSGCEADVVARFVDGNAQRWSALQREDLERGQASADGHTRMSLRIAAGKPSQSTVALDSTGSIALMERLEADFSRIRFAAACAGSAIVELRFHVPTAAPPAA